MEQHCIFCRIVSGDIPCNKVHEDEDIIAFHDIRPIAPVHFLIIPKMHVPSLYECNKSHQSVLGRMFALVGDLARGQGATDGFRTIINTGRVGRQEVYHVHVHVIGGPDVLPGMIVRK